MSHRLQAEGLRVGYRERIVLDGLDVEPPPGRFTAIIGPNASGKSTLLRALARLLQPSAGAVLLDGKDIHRSSTRAVARKLGMLPQQPVTPDGVTVADLVARGRSPHQSWLQQWSRADELAVTEALELTGTAPFALRRVDELSGGQRQRVWIAVVLAQQTPLLLLDEPTTFLDLAFQLDVLDLLDQLNAEQDRTIITVLHDINLAARYAHHMIAMHEGRIVAQGPPDEVIRPALVRDVFGIDAVVSPDPLTGTPLINPRPRRSRPRPRPDAAPGPPD